MSSHSYVRVSENGFWNVEVQSLSKAIETAMPGKLFVIDAHGTNVNVKFLEINLTTDEITALDSIFTTHRTEQESLSSADHQDQQQGSEFDMKDEPYTEEEYDSNKKLIRKTVFAKASGWSFVKKVEEISYEWNGNKLISLTRKVFNKNGLEVSKVITQYSTEAKNGNTIIRQKKV